MIDHETMQRVANAYTAAWNSGSPAAVAEFFAPDGQDRHQSRPALGGARRRRRDGRRLLRRRARSPPGVRRVARRRQSRGLSLDLHGHLRGDRQPDARHGVGGMGRGRRVPGSRSLAAGSMRTTTRDRAPDRRSHRRTRRTRSTHAGGAPMSYAKNAMIAAVSSEKAQRSTALPSRIWKISAVRYVRVASPRVAVALPRAMAWSSLATTSWISYAIE